MKKRRVFLVFACLWLLFIWGNSLIPGGQSLELSAQVAQTVRPEPGLTGDALYVKGEVFRKLAHLAEFGLLSALVVLGLERGKRFWHRDAIAALCGAAAAAADELIQHFVPGRAFGADDLWRDLLGVALGLLAAELLLLLLRRIRQKPTQ